MRKSKRILRYVTTLSFCIFIFSLIGLGLSVERGYAIGFGAKPRDCDIGSFNLSGRCFNEGYASGSQDYDTVVLSFPMPITENYQNNCRNALGVGEYWSFPFVACDTWSDRAYTDVFIDLIEQSLNNYAGAASNINSACDARAVYGSEVGTVPVYTEWGKWMRRGQASAMYVHTMMGNIGHASDRTELVMEPDCSNVSVDTWNAYKVRMNNNVANAKGLLPTWKERIIQYDQLGLINWNGYAPYLGKDDSIGRVGEPNSGAINFGTDVAWHEMTEDGTKQNTILIYSPTEKNLDGTHKLIYGINRDCGNLVGALKPLEPIDNGFTINISAQRPNIGPDEESPNSATFGSTIKFTTSLGITQLNSVSITKKYYVLKFGSTTPEPLITEVAEPYTINRTTGRVFNDSISPLPAGLTAGDRICQIIVVSPGSGNADTSGNILAPPGAAIESMEECATVVNRPYVSFFGSDVKAGGGVIGSGADCVNRPAKIETFRRSAGQGSGVQLAAFALGVITNFTTATDGTSTNPVRDGLTADDFGNYGPNCTADFYAVGADAAATAVSPVTSAPTGSTNKKYKVAGDLTIGSFNVGKGVKASIYVDGDVIINGDITMDKGVPSAWESRSDIPTFKLVATGSIYIQPNVKQLAGLYVAQKPGKVIATCSSGVDGKIPVIPAEMHNKCNSQLFIDGAFIARKAILGRAYGSLRDGGANEHPALSSVKDCSNKSTGHAQTRSCAGEVFLYNPSLYLSEAPYPVVGGGDSYNGADSITNLPPIF